MKIRIAITATLVASLFLPGLSHASEVADGVRVFDLAAPVVVFMRTPSNAGEMRTGSGVIVGQDQVLTNCHVVSDAAQIEVTFFDGRSERGAYAGRFGNLDLCKVTVATLRRPFAKMGALKQIRPGQAVFAVGNPLGMRASISSGVVSAIRDAGEAKLIQISAPISPGSSGGGLFNRAGELIGVTTSTHQRGQNINFAIPIDYVSLLPLSTVLPPSQEESASVSFKGLPFGLSQSAFQKAFPHAVCADATCSGETDFLGRSAQFSALFGEGGLYLAFFRIYSDEPDALFIEATASLIGRFKDPSEFQPGRSATWKWSEPDRKGQGLSIYKCGSGVNCIERMRPGVQVLLGDFRFKSVVRKDF